MSFWVFEYVTSGRARRDGDELTAQVLAEEGLAMLEALAEAFLEDPSPHSRLVHLAWDADRPIPTAWEHDARLCIHPLKVSEDESRWWEQAANATRGTETSGVIIVAPETGRILEALSQRALRAGCRLLSTDPRFIALCGDKTATRDWLAERQVPVPGVKRTSSADGASHASSWIVKPRDGCGSDRVQWLPQTSVPDPDCFPREQWHVEPFCPGSPISVSVLRGPQGFFVMPPCRQHIAIPDDFSYRGGAYPLPENQVDRAQKLARQVIDALPATTGYFGIDMVLGERPEDDVVVEVNPRVTTSIVALLRRASPKLGRIWEALAAGRELSVQFDPRPLRFSANGRVDESDLSCEFPAHSSSSEVVLGLDVGGANIKAASSGGKAASVSFALWRDPGGLSEKLRDCIQGWLPRFGERPAALALTMTGELADCYRTKREGVSHIIDAVKSAAPELSLRIHSTLGRFLEAQEAKQRPLEVAAANWHATASWLALEGRGQMGDADSELMIDMGSTTTDLIPINRFGPASQGKTDPERLASGELVYTGLERTAVAAIVRRLRYRGQQHAVAAETFATSLDVYLMLGLIAERPEDCETADGRPATRTEARDRLARMIGADREMVDDHDAWDLANQIASAQRRQLRLALRRVTQRMTSPPQRIWLVGHGQAILRPILRDLLPTIPIVEIGERLGNELSRAAPAYAVARLALATARTCDSDGVPV